MVETNGNGQGHDVSALDLAQLEMTLYEVSTKVGAMAFALLKHQAGALMDQGHDPRKFKIGIRPPIPDAPVVVVQPGTNIVPAALMPKGMKRGN